MHQDDVEHIERRDRPNTRDKSLFGLAVECLGGKSASIDFTALFHKCLQTLIYEKVTGKSFVSKGWETSLKTHRYTRAVQQNRSLVSFPLQPSSRQRVHD